MNRRSGARAAVATLVLAVGAVSCASDPRAGYSFGSSHDADVKSVSVPIFRNNTFIHGVEVDLTDALVKEIEKSTPWKVTQGSGDSTLSGVVTSADMRMLSSGRVSGLAEEMLVQITVDFSWKNNRTGKMLVVRRNFTAGEPLIPAEDVNERVEVGQHALVQALAKDIVAELRSNW